MQNVFWMLEVLNLQASYSYLHFFFLQAIIEKSKLKGIPIIIDAVSTFLIDSVA